MDSKNLRDSYYRYLRYFLAKDDNTATTYDKYMALAYAVRSELVDNWIRTQSYYHQSNIRRVYYLSMEYIFGKNLYCNMLNLGILEPFTTAVRSLGFSIDELYEREDDFELGNGGKGRIAACLVDSMAASQVPVSAYGLRYDYAQFQQEMKNGSQVERPYDWLHRGHPWEIIRPEYACTVNFSGECQAFQDRIDPRIYAWVNTEEVHAIPYDVPITGYRNPTVNTLRLWSARASEEFLADYVNHGDYVRACEEKSQFGRITKVLFPEEDIRRVTDLRIKQQYFFISATIQDIIRRHKIHNPDLTNLDKKIVIQLNGSRCALAIPEMMRILVDVERVPWEKAWDMTINTFAYTSHAVLKDHLETWPVYKMEQVLPRLMNIIYDINQYHLDLIRSERGENSELIRQLSLIEEGEVKRIRLADLAVLGSFSVNGVSKEQTEIIKKKIFPHFHQFFPERFHCITNGIAHRRWVLCANKSLADCITGVIGHSWITNPEDLIRLESYADDEELQQKFAKIKRSAKTHLAGLIKNATGVAVDDSMLFDIQSRRIHPSKRQVLHIFHILHRYLKIKKGETLPTRRVHIFSGKASPSDALAKQIIHLINVVADLINNDPVAHEWMKVIFIPNFGMTWAEQIVPAADLSEQISAATLESSGTFNMKFGFNGAITIASKSGSNIELIERIGEETIYSFGKNCDELLAMESYHPSATVGNDPRLQTIFSFLEEYLPDLSDGHAIYPLLSTLQDSDRQFVLLDFDDYVQKQGSIDELAGDPRSWNRKCLVTIARMGWFSSDRTVDEYLQKIWKITNEERNKT